MLTEEMLLAKLRRLPERERERLLRRIDEWIEENVTPQSADVQQAVAAVENTWASLSLNNRATLRWVAEDRELEYDLGRSSGRR
jgi:hypothetical protein